MDLAELRAQVESLIDEGWRRFKLPIAPTHEATLEDLFVSLTGRPADRPALRGLGRGGEGLGQRRAVFRPPLRCRRVRRAAGPGGRDGSEQARQIP